MAACKKKTPRSTLHDPIKVFGKTTSHSDEVEGSEQVNGLDGGAAEGAKETSLIDIPSPGSKESATIVGIPPAVDCYKDVTQESPRSIRSHSMPSNGDSQKGQSPNGREVFQMSMPCPSSHQSASPQLLPQLVPHTPAKLNGQCAY